MEYRKLGETDLSVSRLGYGSMGLRGPRTWGQRVVSEGEAESILNAVVDAGVNFIDTAPDYGLSEERIGRYLSRRRHEIILATKCGCDPVQHSDHLEIKHTFDRATVQRNLDASLQRLQTDYIDLLQFHGGERESLLRERLIDWMIEQRQKGKIRHFGISTSEPNIAELIEVDDFESFQLPYSCLDPKHLKWIQTASGKRAGVIVRGGVARGGPQAEIQRPEMNEIWDRARLSELIDEGMSPAQFILRATLSVPAIDTIIVGTCNVSHLQDNLTAAAEGPLPDETLREVNRRVSQALES